jgi:hypothetical protein
MLLAIAIGGMWLIAPAQVGGMVSYHADRPLEIESTGASLAWLFDPTAIGRSFGSVNQINAVTHPHHCLDRGDARVAPRTLRLHRSRAGSNRPSPGRSP